ncbi:MAG: hypothetical protein NVS9B14_03680 [Candidatus Acidiferrum sp.]
MSTENKRVAVIAIHGVGHHESGATAQAVTDLLTGLAPTGGHVGENHYSPFAVRQIQIPLKAPQDPAHIRAIAALDRGGLAATFEERRGRFRNFFSWNAWFGRNKESDPHVEERRDDGRRLDVATEFMHMQLDQFSGDPVQNSFCTWKHEGHRLNGEGTPTDEVHVYEMHWADLARPNNSFLRFFFSFYQLLLHLTSLGRIALDQAALENIGKWDWFLYFRTYTYATRLLTLAIVPLMVLIYGAVLAPLPLLLSAGPKRIISASAFLSACALLGILYVSLRRKPFLGVRSWWFWLVPGIFSGVILGVFLAGHPEFNPLALVLEWWILGAAISYYIFVKYDQVRIGARQLGLLFIILVTAAFFILLWLQHGYDEEALRMTSLLLVQYVFLLLRLLVLVFVLLACLTVLLEGLCSLRLRRKPEDDERLARARTAGRTARFAIAIPALLILLLAAFTGSASYHFVAARADLYHGIRPKTIWLPEQFSSMALSPEDTQRLLNGIQQKAPCPQDCPPPTEPTAAESATKFLQGLIVQSAPPGMALSVGIAGVGFFLLTLIVLPSIYYEVAPPRAASNARSILLGQWLSSGFRHFRWTVLFLWLAAFFVPLATLVFGVWQYIHDNPAGEAFLLYLYKRPLIAVGSRQLLTFGGVLAGSAAVVAGLLVKNLSAVLDTILDVDNYLRTSPAQATPRAKIVERYTALLHHLHQAREVDGRRSYDRIVIVAHSLGSLITADLFRFLHRENDSELAQFAFAGKASKGLPVYFFSMGCPLRQLLNRFFPHLYAWVRPVPEDTGVRNSASEPGESIPLGEPPSPAELGLQQWINFYRSGDYVGRSVWINEVYVRPTHSQAHGLHSNTAEQAIFFDSSEHNRATRIDACIGLGAHTHYWDRTAPDVARQLDHLIAR